MKIFKQDKTNKSRNGAQRNDGSLLAGTPAQKAGDGA